MHLQHIESKIFSDFSDFQPFLEKWKSEGEKIVFTNGCFDLLHRGHLEYLASAADLGSRLVIGLNSDRSVTGLKGLGRPLTDETARSLIIASLSFVSAVILFDEETPASLIKKILPDYLVKGSDYTIHEIAGNDVVTAAGGKVVTIPLLEGYSTTQIIEKIKNRP